MLGLLDHIEPECAELLSSAERIYAAASKQGSNEVEVAREYTRRLMQRYNGQRPTDIDCCALNIESDDATIPARFYSKKGGRQNANNPVVLFFHGGGWSVGDMLSYQPFVEALASQSGIDFISVDYRLAPEHKYPVAHADCFNAVRWVFENAPILGVDPTKIVLMGDSAGGGIAVSAALKCARTTLDIRPHALYLLYPFLDARNNHALYPSREQWGDGQYLIGRESLELASLWYTGQREAKRYPDLYPIADTDLSILPHTAIISARCDPLIDEARAFTERLMAADVSHQMIEIRGAIHGFLPFGSLEVARIARLWLSTNLQERLAL